MPRANPSLPPEAVAKNMTRMHGSREKARAKAKELLASARKRGGTGGTPAYWEKVVRALGGKAKKRNPATKKRKPAWKYAVQYNFTGGGGGRLDLGRAVTMQDYGSAWDWAANAAQRRANAGQSLFIFNAKGQVVAELESTGTWHSGGDTGELQSRNPRTKKRKPKSSSEASTDYEIGYWAGAIEGGVRDVRAASADYRRGYAAGAKAGKADPGLLREAMGYYKGTHDPALVGGMLMDAEPPQAVANPDKWLQEVDEEMEEDHTVGAFTKQARRAGYSNTMEYARKVMAAWRDGTKKVYNKKTRKRQGITTRTMRRANFAINAQKRNPAAKSGKKLWWEVEATWRGHYVYEALAYEKDDDALPYDDDVRVVYTVESTKPLSEKHKWQVFKAHGHKASKMVGTFATSEAGMRAAQKDCDENGYKPLVYKRGFQTRNPGLSQKKNPDISMEAVWSKMKRGEEIDAWGLARSSGAAPIAAEYFLIKKHKQGEATKDGQWYAPKSAKAKKKRNPTGPGQWQFDAGENEYRMVVGKSAAYVGESGDPKHYGKYYWYANGPTGELGEGLEKTFGQAKAKAEDALKRRNPTGPGQSAPTLAALSVGMVPYGETMSVRGFRVRNLGAGYYSVNAARMTSKQAQRAVGKRSNPLQEDKWKTPFGKPLKWFRQEDGWYITKVPHWRRHADLPSGGVYFYIKKKPDGWIVYTREWAKGLHPKGNEPLLGVDRGLDTLKEAKAAAAAHHRSGLSGVPVLSGWSKRSNPQSLPDLGRADILHMDNGDTRYKYNWAVFITLSAKTGRYTAYQAGRPTRKLGSSTTLSGAKKKAQQNLDTGW